MICLRTSQHFKLSPLPAWFQVGFSVKIHIYEIMWFRDSTRKGEGEGKEEGGQAEKPWRMCGGKVGYRDQWE